MTVADRIVREVPASYTLGVARLLAAQHAPVPERSQEWLVAASAQVGLLGRGGAAFPVATKLSAVRRRARVLVNATESEPASWKDRILIRQSPDLVVDGVTLVARALRSPRTVVAVSDDDGAHLLREAARRRGAPIEVQLVRHGFVGGEIGALANGVNGRSATPNGRRVLPHERGLDERSTYASNVETFAQLALLAALGPDGYREHGTPDEPGTSLITLLGDVPTAGVIEVAHGQRLDGLLRAAGRPVLVGGYHGSWTRATDLVAGRLVNKARGLGWGAGVLAVLPEDTCPLGEISRVTDWLAAESAGQCGPCVFGLRSIATDVATLAAGGHVDLDRLAVRLGVVVGRGACHHPTGVSGFVASALEVFADDVARHGRGHCGRHVRGVLPVGGVR